MGGQVNVQAARIPTVAPRVGESLGASAGLLPLGFSGQPFPGPVAVAVCLGPAYPHCRVVILAPGIPAALPLGRRGLAGRFEEAPVLSVGDLVAINLEP